MFHHFLFPVCLTFLLMAAMAGCTRTNAIASAQSAQSALPEGASFAAQNLAEIKDALEGADHPEQHSPQPPKRHAMVKPSPPPLVQTPMITGLGFAQIAGQPGKTHNEKRLMAIRAARLDALRDLAEQVHGIYITAKTQVKDVILSNDTLNGTVQGSIRGARIVRITPKADDAYEVQLALDRDIIGYILRATRDEVLQGHKPPHAPSAYIDSAL